MLPAAPNRHMLIMAREIRSMTQQQLADASGIDQGAISRYENGEKRLTEDAVKAFSEALSFPIAFFCQVYEPVPLFHIQCKHGYVRTGKR
jgi:transcriptional regulator with XRE-family HTH domain